MNFTQLLAELERSATNEITVPADWLQGRATFGGLVAGLLYQGMRAHVPADRPLRSFSISFVGPVTTEQSAQVTARALRSGRAVTQAEAHIVQNGDVQAAALASFGVARESKVVAAGAPAPEVPRPEDLPEPPPSGNGGASFAAHYAYHWILGGKPFEGSGARDMGGWVRLREPVEQLTEGHVLGLIDAWPPAVFPLMTERAPSSTLTWSVDFIQPLPVMSSDRWLLYRAYVEQAADGYGQTSAQVWSDDGRLLAVSRQTVVVFG